jgi:hypothetical protein
MSFTPPPPPPQLTKLSITIPTDSVSLAPSAIADLVSEAPAIEIPSDMDPYQINNLNMQYALVSAGIKITGLIAEDSVVFRLAFYTSDRVTDFYDLTEIALYPAQTYNIPGSLYQNDNLIVNNGNGMMNISPPPLTSLMPLYLGIRILDQAGLGTNPALFSWQSIYGWLLMSGP